MTALQGKVDGQTFEEYNVGGKTVDEVMQYPFEINTEVTVGKTSITVTIDETPYEDLMTGDTIVDKVPDLETYKSKRDGENMEFSRFVDSEGNTFDENTTLAKNEVLTTKYAYKVTIDGDDTYRVEEGLKLSEVPKVAGKLAELRSAKPEKTFGRFEDSDGQQIDEDMILSKSTEIIPIYQVTVKIGGKTYTFDEGGKLSSLNGDESVNKALEELENPGNKVFHTYVVNGREVSREELLDMEFGDNAEVMVKYNVNVKIGNKTVTLPENTKLADANELKGEMEAFEVPEGKLRVAHFVDEADRQINDDSVFVTNTELTPKYMIAVKVTGQDNEGEPIGVEPLELELLEGSSLSKLSEGEKQKLQDWVKENQLALAENGKEKYDLDHFVNELGETVGMDTPLSGGPAELTAVFAYKPEAVTPEEPTPTPETTPSEGSNENTANAGAPDTGSETISEESANMGDAAIVILAVLTSAIMATVVYRRHRKSDTK